MAISTTSIAYILKRLYPESRVQDLVYQDNPLLAMIPKGTGIGGSVTIIATQYGDTVAQSATFSQAQLAAATEANKGVQFQVTRVKDYQLYQLETEAMLAAKSDQEAFVRTLDDTVKGALNNFGRTRGIDLYRDGVGERGQVATGGVSGSTFTLANPNDITNFEVGRVVCFTTGSTKTADFRNSGGGVAITRVDRDAGTFTLSANTDSGAAGDWIFFKGDRAASSYTTPLRLAGLEAWNPATAPAASESFFGVDRSVDASRLGGVRIDISAYNPEEGLVTAIHRIAREGGNPKHLFMNNVDTKNVHLALGAKAITEYTKVGNVGFTSIVVTGPQGDIRLYSDRNAPSGVGRLLQLDTWKLRYLEKLAFVQDLDGTDIQRIYNADAYEGRIAFYGQLTCTAPGWNARLVLPT